MHIYKLMLEHMTDKQRFDLMSKLVVEVGLLACVCMNNFCRVITDSVMLKLDKLCTIL